MGVYGLKRSGFVHERNSSEKLVSVGFKRMAAAPSLFRWAKQSADKTRGSMSKFVDDHTFAGAGSAFQQMCAAVESVFTYKGGVRNMPQSVLFKVIGVEILCLIDIRRVTIEFTMRDYSVHRL